MDNSRGESSQQGKDDEERPLKKARYVWEVKGKHHLKETLQKNNQEKDDANINEETTEEGQATETKDDDVYTKENNVNNNIVCNQESRECHNHCCVDTILANAESIMDSVDDSDDANDDEDLGLDFDPLERMSLVTPDRKCDISLRKWQARQVARGFVDNTINKVLESWMAPSDPEPAASFDATDLVEEAENDGQVEDEGILMAIQSHGLQQPSQESTSQSANTNEMDCSSEGQNSSQTTEVPMDSANSNKVEESTVESMNCDSNEESNKGNFENDNPLDFLSAAVSAAILKKGLAAYPSV